MKRYAAILLLLLAAQAGAIDLGKKLATRVIRFPLNPAVDSGAVGAMKWPDSCSIAVVDASSTDTTGQVIYGTSVTTNFASIGIRFDSVGTNTPIPIFADTLRILNAGTTTRKLAGEIILWRLGYPFTTSFTVDVCADTLLDSMRAVGTVTSVSGTVGSVTGAVGSVTGNVGGNVVGSVASVTGAVGSVTGNVGGNVVGSVASVTGAVGSVTGNVGGSVASVTGAVGSVTGAVGSVTGNVGGNVIGSVASVTGAVGSVTAGVTVSSIGAGVIDNQSINSGAIDGSKIATGAIGSDELATTAVEEFWHYKLDSIPPIGLLAGAMLNRVDSLVTLFLNAAINTRSTFAVGQAVTISGVTFPTVVAGKGLVDSLLAQIDTLMHVSGFKVGDSSRCGFSADYDTIFFYMNGTAVRKWVLQHVGGATGDAPTKTKTLTP